MNRYERHLFEHLPVTLQDMVRVYKQVSLTLRLSGKDSEAESVEILFGQGMNSRKFWEINNANTSQRKYLIYFKKYLPGFNVKDFVSIIRAFKHQCEIRNRKRKDDLKTKPKRLFPLLSNNCDIDKYADWAEKTHNALIQRLKFKSKRVINIKPHNSSVNLYYIEEETDKFFEIENKKIKSSNFRSLYRSLSICGPRLEFSFSETVSVSYPS